MSAQPARAVAVAEAVPMTQSVPLLVTLRDLVTLTKPRLTSLVLCTTAGGLWLAPGSPSLRLVVLTLLGTALVVASAHALNMYLERDVDGLMARTRSRPLPTGRMTPQLALGFGLLLGIVGVPVLMLGVNPLSGLLGALALVLYVLAYTPLKRRSWHALVVGAVPGAIPPLLGWTAATEQLSAPGIALFGVLFLWQVPHFLAISLFRGDDYARAGLKTLPGTRGPVAARRHAILWVAALVPVSLALVPLGVAGNVYLATAGALGAMFFGWALLGLRRDVSRGWARALFYVSLLYLTVLFIVLLATTGAPR